MNTHLPFFSVLLWILSGCTTSAQAQSDTAQATLDCTVLLQDGDQVAVTRFWRIENGVVEYEQDGFLHDLQVADIRSVRCDDRDYAIVNDTLRPLVTSSASHTPANAPSSDGHAPAKPDGSIDYFELGKADATKYYHGGGAFAAGLLTSPLLIVPPIIAAVPPAPRMKNNPNAALYWSEPKYMVGYDKKAHQKKANHAMLGMVVGVSLFFVLPALMIN